MDIIPNENKFLSPKAALECAILDLYGRINNKSICQIIE